MHPQTLAVIGSSCWQARRTGVTKPQPVARRRTLGTNRGVFPLLDHYFATRTLSNIRAVHGRRVKGFSRVPSSGTEATYPRPEGGFTRRRRLKDARSLKKKLFISVGRRGGPRCQRTDIKLLRAPSAARLELRTAAQVSKSVRRTSGITALPPWPPPLNETNKLPAGQTGNGRLWRTQEAAADAGTRLPSLHLEGETSSPSSSTSPSRGRCS